MTSWTQRGELRFLYFALAFALLVAALVVLPPHRGADAAFGEQTLFEIDGNTEGANDWDGLSPVPFVPDECVESNADDVFGAGVQLDSYNSWFGGNGVVISNTPPQGDLCGAWTHAEIADGPDGKPDVILYFAWQRKTDTGEITIFVPLDGGAAGPDDDVLLAFNQVSSGGTGIQTEIGDWAGSAWTFTPAPAGSVDPFVGPNELFAEVAVNISELGLFADDGSCSTLIGTQLMTQTGSEKGSSTKDDDSGSVGKLKDYIGVDISLSDCVDLTVKKATGLESSTDIFMFDLVGSENQGSFTDVAFSQDGAPGSWRNSEVNPGPYTLIESSPNAPWSYQGVSCVGDVDDLNDGDDETWAFLPSGIVTCTITNATQSLTLKKDVTGGSSLASPSAWTLSAAGVAGEASGTLVTGTSGVSKLVPVGTFDLSESGGPDNYTQMGWACRGNSVPLSGALVTVSSGEKVECTVTNEANPASVSLVKAVEGLVGDTAWSFRFTLAPTANVSGSATQVAAGSGNTSSTQLSWSNLTPGTQYTVTEEPKDGYQSWVRCDANVGEVSTNGYTFTPQPGEAISCTATNTADQISVKVTKTVVGGWPSEGGFEFTLTGPTAYSSTFIATSADNSKTWTGLVPGSYDLSEDTSNPDYEHGDLTCYLNGSNSRETLPVSLSLGDSLECTAENSEKPELTLVKKVQGGDATPASWTLVANAGTDVKFSSGETKYVTADATYALSETGPSDGYYAGAWSCTGHDTTPDNGVTLAYGESATCEITNYAEATLTVKKVVDDEDYKNGPFSFTGPDGPFDLSDGSSTMISPLQPVMPGSDGKYTVAETVPDDWKLFSASCVGADFEAAGDNGVTVTLDPGEDAECTFTNQPDAGTLTIFKVMEGQDETAYNVNFTLGDGNGSATVVVAAGAGSGSEVVDLEPGTEYTVTEVSIFDGDADVSDQWETVSAVSCAVNDGQPGGATFTAGAGDVVECSVTNGKLPTLTLEKELGQSAYEDPDTPASWDLSASDTEVVVLGAGSAGPTTVDVGTYDLAEEPNDGASEYVEYYTAGDWSCEGADDSDASSVTLAYGDDAVCTIVNTFEPPLASLALVKDVDGGSASPSQWTLSATGDGGSIEGAGEASGDLPQGAYELTESGTVARYINGTTWSCTTPGEEGPEAFTGLNGNVVTLDWGDDVTCEITNTFDPPPPVLPDVLDLQVVKTGEVIEDISEVDGVATIEWTMTVSHGPNSQIDAEGAVLTDGAPAGMTFVSASSADLTCAIVDNTLTCGPFDLALGDSASVVVTATVTEGGLYENVAEVEVEGDVVESNNVDEDVVDVVEVLPLEILPETGADADRMATAAAILVLFGAALVLGSRRREGWDT